jgi:hypothetical protein
MPDAVYKEWRNSPEADVTMDWLETNASKMLHELMHRNIITAGQPRITHARNNGNRI